MYSNWSKLVLIFHRSSLDLDLDQICEKLGPTWTHYMYSNWSKLVIIFQRSSLDLALDLDLDLWKIMTNLDPLHVL